MRAGEQSRWLRREVGARGSLTRQRTLRKLPSQLHHTGREWEGPASSWQPAGQHWRPAGQSRGGGRPGRRVPEPYCKADDRRGDSSIIRSCFPRMCKSNSLYKKRSHSSRKFRVVGGFVLADGSWVCLWPGLGWWLSGLAQGRKLRLPTCARPLAPPLQRDSDW